LGIIGKNWNPDNYQFFQIFSDSPITPDNSQFFPRGSPNNGISLGGIPFYFWSFSAKCQIPDILRSVPGSFSAALLTFVTLQLHLLVMLLKQRWNTHCLVFIQQALVDRNVMFFIGFLYLYQTTLLCHCLECTESSHCEQKSRWVWMRMRPSNGNFHRKRLLSTLCIIRWEIQVTHSTRWKVCDMETIHHCCNDSSLCNHRSQYYYPQHDIFCEPWLNTIITPASGGMHRLIYHDVQIICPCSSMWDGTFYQVTLDIVVYVTHHFFVNVDDALLLQSNTSTSFLVSLAPKIDIRQPAFGSPQHVLNIRVQVKGSCSNAPSHSFATKLHMHNPSLMASGA
jgi:hypothetical protein